ncbi:PhzF family phenazine biosynthesis protein [Methanocella conradii]|uniref:PhzF family phenazine biosynthesis protein n=1 Tax=Methanocella conradii TaxID=1175444 RepID=UPI0024B3384E|nr:PhzF family phenazine biosynthesis protein [Methanocella conradii]MDI6897577.1 PhzF family phenazine biosynthesis protein [Methanocella conradii]
MKGSLYRRKPENDLNVRVFTKFASVPEDPATGSGNGCLAAYPVKYRYFGEPKIKRLKSGWAARSYL